MWRMTCILVVLLAGASLAQTDPAATEPSAEPPAVLPTNSPIRSWFADLASPDAAVRDKAQTQLMGISRRDLDALRTLIQASRPLASSQEAALHDIVVHVFLATETYEAANDQSFLGVRWAAQDEMIGGTEPLATGVSVEERIPGFPGFQMLRQADLILGIIVNADTPMEMLRPTPLKRALQDAVKSAPTDHPIVMLVLRQGQRMRIPVRLAPKPRELAREQADPAVEAFLAARLQRAEQFWQDEFAPLLRRENVSLGRQWVTLAVPACDCAAARPLRLTSV
jgi:hypothetical protein